MINMINEKKSYELASQQKSIGHICGCVVNKHINSVIGAFYHITSSCSGGFGGDGSINILLSSSANDIFALLTIYIGIFGSFIIGFF